VLDDSTTSDDAATLDDDSAVSLSGEQALNTNVVKVNAANPTKNFLLSFQYPPFFQLVFFHK
ncbi:MAG: hypothetical protein WAZ66_09350, partial [Enterococcus aquimarinus]